MRVRLTAVLITCLAGFALFGVASASAASAVNGGATSVTSTSAVLNGTAHSTSADAGWIFQYGTTTSYGHSTPLTLIGSGTYMTQALVTHLTPATTYHFRLALAQGSYPSTVIYSGDLTFRTLSSGGGGGGGGTPKKYGKGSLASHRLAVRNGRASIRLNCAGVKGTSCKGNVSLKARVKVGKAFKTIRCGSASFNISAGKSHTLKPKLSGGCLTALHKANGHTLRAGLKITFSTHQPTVKTTVTLAL